jgi:hypothetical protein
MHRGFPNFSFSEDQVKEVVKTGTTREALERGGYLIREKYGNIWFYSMGPKGLELVNSWIAECFTVLVFIVALLALFAQMLEMGIASINRYIDVTNIYIDVLTLLSGIVSLVILASLFLCLFFVW